MKPRCPCPAKPVLGLILALLTTTSASAQVSVKQWTFRGGDAEGRSAYFAQSHRFWGSQVYPTDPAFLGKMVRMSTGSTEFLLWFRGQVDPATNRWASSVGMGRPSKANWYQNAFYCVVVDGVPSYECSAELGEATGGERGRVTATWKHPKARIVTSFALLDGDDKLLVETKLEPQAEIGTYQVKLTCYPSSMAGGHAPGLATRDREAVTPTRLLERTATPDNTGQVTAELTKEEPWILFYDNYYDVAHNRGEGPCAAAYSARQTKKATASVQNYPCQLTLTYPSAVTTSHLVVWDLNGMTNAAAKEYMLFKEEGHNEFVALSWDSDNLDQRLLALSNEAPFEYMSEFPDVPGILDEGSDDIVVRLR